MGRKHTIPAAALKPKKSTTSLASGSLPEYHWYSRGARTGISTALYYVKSKKDMEEAVKLFRSSSLLGFDLEWRPNFLKGSPENRTALIQLANEKAIVLFQVGALPKGSALPSSLQGILCSADIVKVGVGIKADAAKLRRDFSIDVQGMRDLSHLGDQPKDIGSLGNWTAVHLKRTLAKPRKVVLSNWEQTLTGDQIEYAANDCYSAWEIAQSINAADQSTGTDNDEDEPVVNLTPHARAGQNNTGTLRSTATLPLATSSAATISQSSRPSLLDRIGSVAVETASSGPSRNMGVKRRSGDPHGRREPRSGELQATNELSGQPPPSKRRKSDHD